MVSKGFWLVTPAGFEPATYRLEVSCSIQLSYGAKHYHCTHRASPASYRQTVGARGPVSGLMA